MKTLWWVLASAFLLISTSNKTLADFSYQDQTASNHSSTKPDLWPVTESASHSLISPDETVVELLTIYGQESASRAKAAELEKGDIEFLGVKITDIIAIAALIFTAYFAVMQKMQEKNKLTLDIWKDYLLEYSKIGKATSLLERPHSISHPEFLEIQRIRNWIDGLALLGLKNTLINNRMLKIFGIESTLRAFINELKKAAAEIKISVNGGSKNYTTLLNNLEKEVSASGDIDAWLNKIKG